MNFEDYTQLDLDTTDVEDVYIPECVDSLKPKIGQSFRQSFNTLEDGYLFYRAYGAACGFTVRKSTMKKANDGTIILRYVVCTHEGFKDDVPVKDVVEYGAKKQKRKQLSCRIYCMARVGFRYEAGIGYVIYKFIEGHTHKLVSEGYRHMLKVHRNLDFGHQFFMAKCFKANIGAVRSFKIYSELVGGVEDVGCRKNDFKNHSRDFKSWANGVDVQVLLEKFRRKRSKNSGFFFDYDVDESNRLTRLFWVDPVSIENCKIFGEAVSFNATYNTNRYSLIFTPFTGRDDQGRCVTFGAGLISREDEESYSWVLSTFVKCMGSQPTMIITDQDLGMRAAIEKVLFRTRHRFCMWHITMKLVEKLPVPLRDDPDFKLKFDDVVWSDTHEPNEFEEKWNDLIAEYNLVGHKWFVEMFRLRKFWIPAFFRDLHMSGLFRTTSLSESENSFFRRHLNKHASLSELYVLFETAIETQRHEHDALSLADETCYPQLVSKLDIEKHAATVYTNSVFLDVQKEIEYALAFCTLPKCTNDGGGTMYEVDEDAVGIFKVHHNLADGFLSCSCKFFVRKGLLCRHMFAVMRNLKLKEIPDKYIVCRWTRKASSIFNNVGQNRFDSDNRNCYGSTNGLVSLALNCIGIVDDNEESTKGLTKLLKDFFDEQTKLSCSSSSSNVKERLIENFYDSSLPSVVSVFPPEVAKTKGSCSRKKSRLEAELKRAHKPMRLCKKCNTLGHHDSRNCEKVNAKKKDGGD